KKDGLFLDKGEELVGAWAEVEVKDRPHPYRFEIDKKGWQTVTSKGESNVFWERKGPWMAAKGALKNCCRLAFPHLAGLMSRPELGEEEPASDAAVPARSRDVLYRRLFALGSEVAPPLGPLQYPQLHALSIALFRRGMSETTDQELAQLTH